MGRPDCRQVAGILPGLVPSALPLLQLQLEGRPRPLPKPSASYESVRYDRLGLEWPHFPIVVRLGSSRPCAPLERVVHQEFPPDQAEACSGQHS